MRHVPTFLLAAVLACTPAVARAQTTPPDPATQQQPPPPQPNNDVRVDPLQPDFTLITLPTTLRMPAHKWAFRVTHRFNRPLGRGNLGDLFENFFGFDSGAQIGLEVRYGLAAGTQIGIHRTSDRTIQLFGEQNLMSERKGRKIGLDAIVTWEGEDNLTEHHQSTIGAIMSRSAGKHFSFYFEPLYVVNSSPFTEGDNDTFMIGLGTRIRVTKSLYLVGEMTPRVSGFDPGVDQASFAIEGRAGGHSFQLNFSNAFGTTLGQISRGGFNNDDWYLGFNISRKFF